MGQGRCWPDEKTWDKGDVGQMKKSDINQSKEFTTKKISSGFQSQSG